MASLRKTNEIDLIGIDHQSRRVVLTILDSLDWENEHEHLLLLQEKINTYLTFIESAEIYGVYPKAIGRQVEIEVRAMCPLPDIAQDFVAKVTEIIDEAGFVFVHKVTGDVDCDGE